MNEDKEEQKSNLENRSEIKREIRPVILIIVSVIFVFIGYVSINVQSHNWADDIFLFLIALLFGGIGVCFFVVSLIWFNIICFQKKSVIECGKTVNGEKGYLYGGNKVTLTYFFLAIFNIFLLYCYVEGLLR